jgi:mycofactocin precursor
MPETATELLERPADEITTTTTSEALDVVAAAGEHGDVIAADLLVEEISIDGMCGVY